MIKSRIEELICDRSFSYLRPYFYNNRFSMRCELGKGQEDYAENAKKRATEIFNILFPAGADAIIFNYWLFDYSESGEAEKYELREMNVEPDSYVKFKIDDQISILSFLLKVQIAYRHHSVTDLEVDDDGAWDGRLRRNRIICYRDDVDFDYEELIGAELNGTGQDVSFVSFENECIMSVYDDRGCDIVFATHDKFKEFYHRLEPYFLAYDLERMKKTYIEQ